MTNEEVNKIIAEYMGIEFVSMSPCETVLLVMREGGNEPDYKRAYTNSLDVLVPVWKKLKYNIVWIADRNDFSLNVVFDSTGETIQQAAAIATAKAIQGLK